MSLTQRFQKPVNTETMLGNDWKWWIVPKESYREKGVGVPFLDLRRVRPSWVASLVASTKTPEAELLSGSRSYHTNAQVLWYYITSVVVLLRFDIVPIQCSIMERLTSMGPEVSLQKQQYRKLLQRGVILTLPFKTRNVGVEWWTWTSCG